MKKLLSALTVVCVSACSTVNYKDQVGIVEIQVETAEVLAVYEANLTDFYQVMSEGLAQSAMPGYLSIKSEFNDVSLVQCAQDEECKITAYDEHFRDLHKYIYKTDLSNVEGIYIEPDLEGEHLFEVYGFYAFVGESHERLAIFVDEMTIKRNVDVNPYGIERIQSIDAILYRQDLMKPAEYHGVGEHRIEKIVRLKRPLELNDLYYSIDVSEIDFTDFFIGISIHLASHNYEISIFDKVDDIRPNKGPAKATPKLY